MNKLKEVQESTILDILDKLEKFGKVLCVRPTGFGKTTIAIQIMDYFENVIVFYPNINIGYSIISKTTDNDNILFMTYCKLVNNKNIISSKEFVDKYNSETTLIICDEAHMLGAQYTSECIKTLQTNCKKARFLGLTATPNRTDKNDIIDTFFDGHITFPYSLRDAMDDGIFIKPKYVYTLLDQSKVYDKFYSKIEKSNISNKNKKELIAKLGTLVKYNDITNSNIANIIRSNIDERKYYKFITFHSNIDSLNNKKCELESIFKQAFPGFDVNILVITSESGQTRSNLKLLDQLRPIPNTIDLILTINMLNFGYHVDDLTGILMFRSTESNIIFTQQVGRVLSVTSQSQTIIFDFVENFSLSMDNMAGYNRSIRFITENDTLGLDIFIELDSYLKDILDIDRLIQIYSIDDISTEVVSAYENGLVDLSYCLSKLKMTETQFNDFLNERRSI